MVDWSRHLVKMPCKMRSIAIEVRQRCCMQIERQRTIWTRSQRNSNESLSQQYTVLYV